MKKFDPIKAIEARAKKGGFKMSAVLAAAKVDESTWWRNKNGKASPLMSTLEKIDQALDKMEARKKIKVVK